MLSGALTWGFERRDICV